MTHLEAVCIDSAEKTPLESPEKNEAYPVDTSGALLEIIKNYKANNQIQTVSFRSLVSWIKMGERATHYIHPYPAKLLPQIAHFFLGAKSYFGKNLNVLDPFGGTGTVALEAILSGNKAYYSDANPLARLIAKTKTNPLCTDTARLKLEAIIKAHKKSRKSTPPDVVNIKKWYKAEHIKSLTRLKHAIEEASCPETQDFFNVTFSAVARKVSLADPRLSVPVRLKSRADAESTSPQNSQSVMEVFLQQAETNISRMENFRRLSPCAQEAKCVGFDARKLKSPLTWNEEAAESLDSESIDLIITSPPYAGAQKYIRASSLNLGWLGLTKNGVLKPLENLSIGREHLPKAVWEKETLTGIHEADRVLKRVREKNKVRAAIAATYLNEMRQSLNEAARVLRKGGHLVLVIGNNEVCGEVFESSLYLKTIANEAGLSTELELVDEIKSRGLMTKRNKTAGIISREWVLLFKKI